MQTNQLPDDMARCHGFQCQERKLCLRHLERETYKAHTPFVSHACEGEGLSHFIPVHVVAQ